MSIHARGTFEVTLTPQAPQDGEEAAIGRVTLDKQFHGDIEATSRGLMLSAGNPAAGAAGYVAMERVVGTVNGKRGSFILQHSGTMTPEGGGDLVITVVPSSGTEELAGLSGRCSLEFVGKDHLYDFEYSIE
jgi:hypothetical protein